MSALDKMALAASVFLVLACAAAWERHITAMNFAAIQEQMQ